MGAHKQYVNLDPGAPNELKEIDPKRAGRTVFLTAKLNKAVEGVPVVFEIKAGAKNVCPSLESSNFSMKERFHLFIRHIALPGFAKRRALTDKNGHASIDFQLSACGGDEFEVKAYVTDGSGKKKSELASDTFVVWRRFYLQVSRFGSGAKAAGRTGAFPAVTPISWAPIIAEFKDQLHHVEIVDESGVDLITRRCQVLDEEDHITKSAREGFDPKREPVVLRAVLVPLIASEQSDHVEAEVTEGVPVMLHGAGPLYEDETYPEKKDWLRSARMRLSPKHPWEPLDEKYVERVDEWHVRVKIDQIPKKHFFDVFGKRKAEIDLWLRMLKGSTNGLSWYNAIWLAEANMHQGPRAEVEKQATAIHEIGHFLGITSPGQKTHYVGKGHQGPHCSEGLSGADLTKKEYRGLSGTCVMFGESSKSRKGHFCGSCSPALRAQPIRLLEMPKSWQLAQGQVRRTG